MTAYDDAMADAARNEYEIEKIEDAQTIYAVHKQGYVYSHGVWGIYTDEDAAIKAANDFAQADCDSYHTWQVLKIPLNKPWTADETQDYDDANGFMEQDNGRDPVNCIYSVQKET